MKQSCQREFFKNYFMKENLRIILWLFLVNYIAILIACNAGHQDTSDYASVITTDSIGTSLPDTNSITTDTTARSNLPDRRPAGIDTSGQTLPEQQQHEIIRGYAIVYCPSKMIIHVPSIIDAAITKSEFDSAYAEFVGKYSSKTLVKTFSR